MFIKRKADDLFGLDLRSLALARVSIASIVLVDLAIRATGLSAHYGSGSIFPPEVLQYDWVQAGLWSYSFVITSPTFTGILFILNALFAFMLLIGWHTRFASIATFMLVLSMQHANPIILQSGDILLRLLLLIGIFVPWGKYFSVDQALSFMPAPKRTLSFWTAAYLIQITSMYFFASMLKSDPVWTTERTGVYYALSIDQLSTPIGEFMLGFPLILMFLTTSVWVFQHAVPILIFSPYRTEVFRTVAIVLLTFMHVSFALHMHLGPFSWISLAFLAGLLPTRFWDALSVSWLPRLGFGNIAIYYDGECGFCKKSVYLIRAFLLLPKTSIAAAQTDASIYTDLRRLDSWVVVDRKGGRHFSYDAAIALVAASPMLFWLAPLMRPRLFVRIGDAVYRFIAKHRSRSCEPETPARERGPMLRAVWFGMSSALAVAFMIYTFVWNANAVPPLDRYFHMPEEYKQYGIALGIDQYWGMFSPYPLKEDGWFILLATHADGRETDLFRGGAPVDFQKPKNVSALYVNERWRKYHMNIMAASHSRFRKYYTDYLCRSANEGRSGGDRVMRVEIVYMMETTLPDYRYSPPVRHNLESRECTPSPN